MKELSKNRLRWNGHISLWKKQWNTWIASSSRHASTWHTMEFVPSCSAKKLSSRTSRSRPFTFMTSGIPSQTRWIKEKLDGWYRVSNQKAFFRRQPRGGKSSFTVISLHINEKNSRKRGFGKKLLLAIRAVMLDEHIDLVAGDFDGAAWRRQTSSGNLSFIEEAFADSDSPMPPSPTPLWGQGAVPGACTDVCGFFKPPHSYECWKVWCILHSLLNFGLRSRDQSCHHEVFLQLDFVNEHGDHEPRERHEPRLL